MENKNIENTNIMENQQTLPPILEIIIPKALLSIHFEDNNSTVKIPSKFLAQIVKEYFEKNSAASSKTPS